MSGRLYENEELLKLLHSNTALLFTASCSVPTCYRQLTEHNSHGSFATPMFSRLLLFMFCLQVYFDSAMHIFPTSMKNHVFHMKKKSLQNLMQAVDFTLTYKLNGYL